MADVSLNSKPTQVFSKILVSWSVWISTTLLLSSVFYALYAISEQAVENTRISENALLAGLVDEQFKDSAQIQRYANAIQKQYKDKNTLKQFIIDEYKRLRIEVFRHSYSCAKLAFFTPDEKHMKCGDENIYAIIRAYRATPAEAILIMIPLRQSHINSLAIVLAFTKYANQQIYWARDIIFVFVDGGSPFGAESWLSAYHGYKHPFYTRNKNDSNGLQAHGGAIIGAVVIDVIGSVFSQVEVQYGMMNGGLPNLDLVNLFILLIDKAGTRPSLYGIKHRHKLERSFYDYNAAAQTLIRAAFTQSFVEYESLGSLFGNYGLNAVTLRARQSTGSSSGEAAMVVNLMDMTQILEGGVRSLNNIIEKFHQSYFMYLLPTTHKFISIAYYMPLIGLMVAPFLFLGLREWIAMNRIVGITAQSLFTLFFTHLIAAAFYSLQLALYNKVVLLGVAEALGIITIFPEIGPMVIAELSVLFPLLPLYLMNRVDTTNFHSARFFMSLEMVLFTVSISIFHFNLAAILCLMLLPLLMFSLIIAVDTPLWRRCLGFVFLNPISVVFLLSVLVYSTNVFNMTNGWMRCLASADFTHISACFLKQFMQFRRQVLKFVLRTALNHFAHSSVLLVILSGPVFSIYLSSAQIIFFNK